MEGIIKMVSINSLRKFDFRTMTINGKEMTKNVEKQWIRNGDMTFFSFLPRDAHYNTCTSEALFKREKLFFLNLRIPLHFFFPICKKKIIMKKILKILH